VAKNHNFFLSRKAGSEIKTAIVINYFKSWAAIMANQVRNEADPRLLYLDLYCGPGRYDDGQGNSVASTAIAVLEHAVGNDDLRNMLISLFNDANEDHTKELIKNIAAIPNIGSLKREPMVRTGEVDGEITKLFAGKKIVPTFSFIDPFGFKGLTLELIDSLLNNFGCDMVLFFNFNQINRFLTTAAVRIGQQKEDSDPRLFQHAAERLCRGIV
jgi:three-Cys-motif partner protein